MQKKVNVKGKQLMKQPRYFCDLINGGLYQGKQRLLPEMIRAMPEVLTYSGNSQTGEERDLERIPDIVYAAGKEADYLLILEENQKKTDYGMPLRNMLDVTLAYLQQKKELEVAHKQKHDLKPGSEYLSGLAKKDRLHPYTGNQKKMQDYIKKNEEHFSHLSEDECDALEVFTGMKKLDKEERNMYRNPEGGDYNMCTAFVEMVEEGKKEGIKEGETLLTRLAQAMRADGREEEFFDCCAREDVRKNLLQEYGISREAQ